MPDFGGHKASGGDPSLNEINRADRFLDALAAKAPVYSTDQTEADLAFLLGDWRDTIRDPAPTVPVTARDAVAALNDGLAKRHSRGSLTIVGSAAAALLCIGGFGAAVYGAGPGDTLYGARTAVFGAPRVSDDQVMLAAQTEMAQVQTLIDQGQWQQAQDKLQQLSPTVQSVDTPEHKQQLIEQWNALTYKVVEQNPQAILPPAGEPLPQLPSSPLTLLPVPVIVAPGESQTHTRTHTSPTESTSTDTSASDTPSTSPESESPATSPTSASATPASPSSPVPSESTSSPDTSAPAQFSEPSPTSSPSTSGSTPTSSARRTSEESSSVPTTSVTEAPTVSTAPATSQPSAAVTTTSAAPESSAGPSVTVTRATTAASPTAVPTPPAASEEPAPSTHKTSSHGSNGPSNGQGHNPVGVPGLQLPWGQH